MHLSVLNKQSAPLSVWRRQIGCQSKIRRCRGPRPLAIVNFFARQNTTSKLVDIRRLSVCVLHDQFEENSHPRIRFAGYKICPVPWGINIGGSSQIFLDKDLCLSPKGRAFGRRFVVNDSHWLAVALRMDGCLARHARFPFAPRRSELRLPKFWAALSTGEVQGDGPEFAKLCQDFQLPADVALLTCARRHRGQIIYPLEFVSHEWRRFSNIYADLRNFLSQQVIRLSCADKLGGFIGACQYDLLSSPHQWRRA